MYASRHQQIGSTELSKYVKACDRCEQILKGTDFTEHMKFHTEIETDNKLNKNFPKLSIKK